MSGGLLCAGFRHAAKVRIAGRDIVLVADETLVTSATQLR
jgi:hypothetical protein